ncbi:MAG: hypothetical protein ACLFVU_02785 [Phycisphaerae bacterium]
MNTRRKTRGAKAFTLIEVLGATIIIGIAVVALLAAMTSGTSVNEAGTKTTKAVFLAQEIREWTMRLPFSDPDSGDADNPPGPDGTNPQTFVDDLDDLMDVTYNPPRNGMGNAITDMVGWSQTITLTWRNPDDLAVIVTPGSSDVINVEVSIRYQDEEILSNNWLVTRR